MNTYLIPANAKSGKLIFGIFRKIDLIIFGSGVFVSFILLLILSPDSLGEVIVALLPGSICALLICPVPNYHNILIVIQEMIRFFYNRRNYKWEGWCYKDEFK